MLLTFSLFERKSYKKKQTTLQVDRLYRFFAFSGDELVKIETQVCTLWRKRQNVKIIPAIFTNSFWKFCTILLDVPISFITSLTK